MRRRLQRLLSNSENTLSSVVATFNAPLTIFADAVVDAATSADDFRLGDVRRRMSVYVRHPARPAANARPLLNLLFAARQPSTRGPAEQDPTLKVQCLLVNDEFTAMGRVASSPTPPPSWLAGLPADRHCRPCRNSMRLRRQGARTFATNHGLQRSSTRPRERRDADGVQRHAQPLRRRPRHLQAQRGPSAATG